MVIKEKIAKRPGRPPKLVKKDSAKSKPLKTEPPAEKKEVAAKEVLSKAKYIYALGRRKCAKAQVRLMETGTGGISINGRDLNKYFILSRLQEIVKSPLQLVQEDKNHDLEIKINGGGFIGQAEAARLGLARALIKWNPVFRPVMKKAGFLHRDPRVKERKKFGLKKARKAPQWSKR